MKVFISRQIPEIGISLLKKKGFDVEIYKGKNPISKKELIKKTRNCDGLISLLNDKIDKPFLDQLKKCKVIANFAVGYNNIDVQYASSKNIVVTNTPEVLTDSTADLTMTLVLACARRLFEAENFIREKKFKGWEPKLLLGVELKNKNFGILGAGRIGAAVGKRAYAFGCKILYYSQERNYHLEKETKAKKVSLNKILKESDIISIHLPLNSDTKNLLNANQLNLLKSSAILINTARGEIVDENHLIKLLKNKRLFFAGLDVYTNEPQINTDFYKLKNAIMLPHIGSATVEARDKMSELAARNVIAVLSGKNAITPVN